MIKVLVTGANGQLGLELAVLEHKFPNLNIFFTDKNTLNIVDFEAMESYISTNKIDVIVNCAAYTQVDKAEDESKIADKVNHLAVKNLGLIAKMHQLKLIHISIMCLMEIRAFLMRKLMPPIRKTLMESQN